MKPEESAECHQTLSSQVGSGHKTKAEVIMARIIHTQIGTFGGARAKGYLLTLFSCFKLCSCGAKKSMEVREGSGHMRVM